jgi:putative zinc finger protein
MTDTSCTYPGNRDDALIAYLYDDIDPVVRETFDAHLTSCGRCRRDLADLRDVRADLAKWTPPQPVPSSQFSVLRSGAPSPQPPAPIWRSIPAWAQVAAALLILGVSAGIANLNVHYGADGLTVRTGWSSLPSGPSEASRAEEARGVGAAKAEAPWRADLTALEQQLRSEFRTASTASAPSTPAVVRNVSASPGDADLIRRVRALEDASRQQRNEFSLQLAAALRDVNAQRRADLVRIDQNLGLIQNNTGIEVAKQREMLNYLVRVSSQK